MEVLKNNMDLFSQKIDDFRKNKTYPLKAIDLVEKHRQDLVPILDSWDNAFDKVSSAFGIDSSKKEDIPHKLHQFTFEKISQKLEKGNNPKAKIIGIAGPGACGKGSLIASLDLPKVVNTTTRLSRSYEVDQVDYHFIDISSFQKMLNSGEFLTTSHKPGRGWYGVEKNNLNKILKQSQVAVIEGNPETLFKIQKSVNGDVDKSVHFTINYILPPYPTIPHLATRLAKRCLETNGNFLNLIDSTLGQRQVDEFESLIDIAKNGGNICFFVINNDIDEIASLMKKTYQVK